MRAAVRRPVLALVLVLVVALAGACAGNDSGGPRGSVSGPGSSLTPPTRPDVTTRPEPSTTERPQLSTTSTEFVITTSTAPETIPTTTADLPTRTTEAPPTLPPPTIPPPTIPPPTNAPVVPTTVATTEPTLPPTTVPTPTTTAPPATLLAPVTTTSTSESSPVPWLLLIVLAAGLAGLVVWLLAQRRSQRQAWWRDAEGLVRDAGAIRDLATSGPAAPTPAEQVAHWSMLEQRIQALSAALEPLIPDAPGDEARAALEGLWTAAAGYLDSVHTVRALHLGPPPPTDEQLEFAEAGRTQRLAELDAATAGLKRLTDAELHAP